MPFLSITYLQQIRKANEKGLSFLFAALRVIYSRCPSHLFIIFCAFLNGPGIAVRTKMKRVLVFRALIFRVSVFQVLVFRVLVFRVLGLSFPDTH